MAAKLVLNLLLTGLVLVALAPEVAAHAEQARQFDAGLPAPLEVGQLIFPPIVSPTALLLAMILAVFKPWAGSVAPADQNQVTSSPLPLTWTGRGARTGSGPAAAGRRAR